MGGTSTGARPPDTGEAGSTLERLRSLCPTVSVGTLTADLMNLGSELALLEQAGFATERFVSTLFQRPGHVRKVEAPLRGFSPHGGFTIVVAGKTVRRGAIQRREAVG